MGVGPEIPPNGGGQNRSEAGQLRIRSSFLSQEGMIPGSNSHGKEKRHPQEHGVGHGGAWAGFPVVGAVSTH